jgi:hypothetical protein
MRTQLLTEGGAHRALVYTMLENHSVPAQPGGRFDFLKNSRAAVACLSAAALFLSGCAQLPPMVTQLKTEKTKRIVLVAEKGPFEYTVPAAMDAQGGGIPLMMLIGGLVAISVQKSLETTHGRLVAAASGQRLASDHRQAFIEDLTQRLKRQDIDVTVMYVPYESTQMGGDRRFFQPMLDDVKVPPGVPAFSLNLDVGSCTFGAVTPCIRYALREVFTSPDGVAKVPVAKPPPGTNGTIVGAGIPEVGATPLPRFKYRPVAGTTPDFSQRPVPESRRFPTVDDAVANIAEFDGTLAKLVPAAVDQLTASLEADVQRRP